MPFVVALVTYHGGNEARTLREAALYLAAFAFIYSSLQRSFRSEPQVFNYHVVANYAYTMILIGGEVSGSGLDNKVLAKVLLYSVIWSIEFLVHTLDN